MNPHKLFKTLSHFETYFGPEQVNLVSRGCSKMYEETIRGTVQGGLTALYDNPPKERLVIVVAGKE